MRSERVARWVLGALVAFTVAYSVVAIVSIVVVELAPDSNARGVRAVKFFCPLNHP